MFDALYIAATGMQAQQLNVDTIANNLANVNTVGFKKQRVSFVDLIGQQSLRAEALAPIRTDPAAGPLADPVQIGSGVGVASVSRAFDVGELKQTGSAFDLAIQGDGFLEVVLRDGSRGYSRGGTLKVNTDGLLVTQSGLALAPGITIPSTAAAFGIDPDGTVRVKMPGQANPLEAGRIELARFANPSALVSIGDGVFRASEGSGEAMMGRPGEEGAGTLTQGALEGSNVKMLDEVVSLMVAQRAYEASAKVIQASDEMLGMVNSLRK